MIWRSEPAADSDRIAGMARALAVPHAAAVALWRRGLDATTAPAFLDPRLTDLGDPFALPDMAPAVERIGRALAGGERVTIFGDYDADGITAAAVAGRTLRALGAAVKIHLPHRADEGYGLSSESLRRCLEETRPQLIVTVDCGSCSADAVREATRAGVDVIVSDHHEMLGPPAPALAVVNPRRTDRGDLPAAVIDLAGVGVAFKLCHALVKDGRARGLPAAAALDLRDTLEWVALGTVADVVPLMGENRILVAAGLKRINQAPGIAVRALMAAANIRMPLESRQIAFGLGPRLNAVGRLGAAQAALDLLLTDDAAEATRLAAVLERANGERRDLVDATLAAAETQLAGLYRDGQPFGIVLGGRDWPVGVIGIVAARIAQRYQRPAIVVSFDAHGQGRGSARSIAGFHLLDGLQSCAEVLSSFGGHAAAAGLSVDADGFDAFRQRFDAVAAAALRGRDLRPVLAVEDWLTPADLNASLWMALNRMAPFGEGNPRPVWAMRAVRLLGRPRVVGKGHLKMTLTGNGTPIDAVGFNMAGREPPETPMDVAFHLVNNEFRGQASLQLHLQDFRPAIPAEETEAISDCRN